MYSSSAIANLFLTYAIPTMTHLCRSCPLLPTPSCSHDCSRVCSLTYYLYLCRMDHQAVRSIVKSCNSLCGVPDPTLTLMELHDPNLQLGKQRRGISKHQATSLGHTPSCLTQVFSVRRWQRTQLEPGRCRRGWPRGLSFQYLFHVPLHISACWRYRL